MPTTCVGERPLTYAAWCPVQEAGHVADLVRHFYLVDWRTVETFNTAPAEFDFQRFMDHCPRSANTRPTSDIV